MAKKSGGESSFFNELKKYLEETREQVQQGLQDIQKLKDQAQNAGREVAEGIGEGFEQGVKTTAEKIEKSGDSVEEAGRKIGRKAKDGVAEGMAEDDGSLDEAAESFIRKLGLKLRSKSTIMGKGENKIKVAFSPEISEEALKETQKKMEKILGDTALDEKQQKVITRLVNLREKYLAKVRETQAAAKTASETEIQSLNKQTLGLMQGLSQVDSILTKQIGKHKELGKIFTDSTVDRYAAGLERQAQAVASGEQAQLQYITINGRKLKSIQQTVAAEKQEITTTQQATEASKKNAQAKEEEARAQEKLNDAQREPQLPATQGPSDLVTQKKQTRELAETYEKVTDVADQVQKESLETAQAFRREEEAARGAQQAYHDYLLLKRTIAPGKDGPIVLDTYTNQDTVGDTFRTVNDIPVNQTENYKKKLDEVAKLKKEIIALDTQSNKLDVNSKLYDEIQREITKRKELISIRNQELAGLESLITKEQKEAYIAGQVASAQEKAAQASAKLRDEASGKKTEFFDAADSIKALESAQGKTEEYKAKVSSLNTEIAKIKDAWSIADSADDAALNDLMVDTDATIKKIGELKKELTSDKFNTFNASGANKGTVISSGDFSNIERARAEMEKYLATLGLGEATTKKFDSATGKMVATFQTSNGIYKTVTQQLNSNQSAIRAYTTETTKTAETTGAFQQKVSSLGKELKQLVAYYTSARMVISQLRQSLNVTSEFDAALTDISYTMDLTSSGLDKMGDSIIDLANDYGVALENAKDTMKMFDNINTTQEQMIKQAEPTVMLANAIGNGGYQEAAGYLQATIAQFDLATEEAEHIVDVFEHISRNTTLDYAKSMQDISEGIQVAGTAARYAGLDYAQLASIIGTTAEKTRKSGSEISRALNTILTRTSKASVMDETVTNETLSAVSKTLDEIGIKVYELDGTYREFDTIMTELSDKWEGLTDAQQANISFQMAATRQSNIFKAILEGWTETMDLAEEAQNESYGLAQENQEKYANSMTALMNEFSTAADTLRLSIFDNEGAKSLISTVTDLLNLFAKLIETVGVLPTMLAVSGAALSKFSNLNLGASLFGQGSNKIDMSAINTRTREAEISIRDYNEALLQGSLTEERRNQILARSDELLRGMISTSNGATVSVDNYAAALMKQTMFQDKEIKGYKAVKAAQDYYNQSAGISAERQRAWVNAVGESNTKLGNYLNGLNGAKASMAGYAKNLVATTLKTKSLQVVTTAMNMTFNALIGMGIGIAINTIATAYDNWAHSAEKAAEALKQAQNNIRNGMSEFAEHNKQSKEVGERYAELAQGVEVFGTSIKNTQLTNDEFEEFKEVSNQLADLYPDLTKAYDENGVAILSLNGDVETITESLREMNAAARGETLESLKNDFKTVFDSAVENVKAVEEELDKLNYQKQLGPMQGLDFGGLRNQFQQQDNLYLRDGVLNPDGRYTLTLETDLSNFNDVEQQLDSTRRKLEELGFTPSDARTENSNGNWTLNFSVSKEDYDALLQGGAEYARGLEEQIVNKLQEREAAEQKVNDKLKQRLELENSFADIADEDTKNAILEGIDFMDFDKMVGDTEDSLEARLSQIEQQLTNFFKNSSISEELKNDVKSMFSGMEDLTVEEQIAMIDRIKAQMQKEGVTFDLIDLDTMKANIQGKMSAFNSEVQRLFGMSADEMRAALSGYMNSDIDVPVRVIPQISIGQLNEAGYNVAGNPEDIIDTFAKSFANEDNTIAMNFTPVITDAAGNVKGVLTPQELEEYAKGVIAGTQPDHYNLKIGATFKGEDAVKDAKETLKTVQEASEVQLVIDTINTEEQMELFIKCARETDNATEAVEKYKDELAKLKNEAPAILTISELFEKQKESIDGVQSSLSTIDNALGSLDAMGTALAGIPSSIGNAGLDTSAVIDLCQQFPELIHYVDLADAKFGNLEQGLKELRKQKLQETIDELEKMEGKTEEDIIAIEKLKNALASLGNENFLDFSGFASDISNITSSVGGLTKAMSQLKEGTALTKAELANLALQYPELLEMENLFAKTSVKSQQDAINTIIDMEEQAYQAKIDAKIAEVEAMQTAIQAQIDLEAQKQQKALELLAAEKNGELATEADYENKLNELMALESQNFVTKEQGKLVATEQGLNLMTQSTNEAQKQQTNIWDTAGKNMAIAVGNGATAATSNIGKFFTSIVNWINGGWKSALVSMSNMLQQAMSGDAVTGAAGGSGPANPAVGARGSGMSNYSNGPMDSSGNNTKKYGGSGVTTIGGKTIDAFVDEYVKASEQRVKELQEQYKVNTTIINNLKGLKNIKLADVSGAASGSGSGSSKNKGGSGSGKSKGKDKKKKGSKSDKDKDKFEESFDWIEVAIKRTEDALAKLDARVNDTYRSWSSRNKYLAEEISKTQGQIALYQASAQGYKSAASSVGLSKQYRSKVQNGTMQIETITDEKLANKIKAYQEYWDAYKEMQNKIEELQIQAKELATQQYEFVITQYEAKIQKVQNAIDKTQAQIDNVGTKTSAKQYNTLKKQYKQQIDLLTTEEKNARAALARLAASGISKSSEYYLEQVNELNAILVEIESLKGEMAQIVLDKFNLITTDFEHTLNKIEHAAGILDNSIALMEARGKVITAQMYKAQAVAQEQLAKNLRKEKQKLQKELDEALASGSVKKGSEAYWEMYEAIQEVDSALSDATLAIEEFQKQAREAKWEQFDLLLEKLQAVNSELEFFKGLFDDAEGLYNDDGSLNNEGLASAYLAKQNMDAYKYQMNEIYSAIEELDKQFEDDPLNVDYLARRQELVDAYYEAAEGAKAEREEILKLAEQGYKNLLDEMQEYIDKRKEALQAERDAYEYQKTIAKQTANISNLQKQLQAQEGNNTEEGRAKRQQLQQELRDAQEELKETEYDRFISDQEAMLDQMYSEYEAFIDEKINQLSENLDEILAEIDANSELARETIGNELDELGIKTVTELGEAISGTDSAIVDGFAGTKDAIYATNSVLGEIKSLVNQLYITSQKAFDDKQKEAEKSRNEYETIGQLEPVSPAPGGSGGTITMKDKPSGGGTSGGGSSSGGGSKSGGGSGSGGSSSGGGSSKKNMTGIPWKDYPKLFSYKRFTGNKDKLNKNDSVIDRMKWWDLNSSMDARTAFYKGTGKSDTYKGKANQNAYLLKWMKNHGYSKGGTLSPMIKAAGEDGIFFGRKDEEVITKEKVQQLQEIFKKLDLSEEMIGNMMAKSIAAAKAYGEQIKSAQYGDINVDLTFPNVTNYQEFRNELIKDKGFENAISSMVENRVIGKKNTNLAKMKYIKK